jgi:hypothetical protein
MDGKVDTITPHEHSVIPDYINGLKLYEEFEFTEVWMKDSRSLTKEDIDKVLVTIENTMAPLKGFDASDGPFSLGFAVAKVQELPAGIYLCMNGESFTSDEAAKNISEGKFYSIFHQTNN